MKVYTMGYEKISLANYVQLLEDNGVGGVIDVRETPWSYNRVYVKGSLSNALNAAGMEYVHLRSCGNPSANRKASKTIKECLERYREYLYLNQGCLAELYREMERLDMSGRPGCLTCFELSHEDCHRSILLEALDDLVPDLEVVHLRSPSAQIKIASAPVFLDTTAQLS